MDVQIDSPEEFYVNLLCVPIIERVYNEDMSFKILQSQENQSGDEDSLRSQPNEKSTLEHDNDKSMVQEPRAKV